MAKFQKATKKRIKLRMAIAGVSGSGKTYSSLAIASGLGSRVAVIDSERGSASLYSDFFEFDVVELDHFSPGEYMSAIRAAAEEGYDVLVIDSLSHAWAGEGGVLDVSRKNTKGGAMGNWKEASPLQEKLIGSILDFPGHVIVTMRSKTEYVISEKNGRVGSVEKVGLAPVQRQGVEYEFDVCGDIENQTLSITKSRIPALQGRDFHRPGLDVAKTLIAWIEGDGEKRVEEPREPPKARTDLKPIREKDSQPERKTTFRSEEKPPAAPVKEISEGSITQRDWRCMNPQEVGKPAHSAGRWQREIIDAAKLAKEQGAFDSWPDKDKELARLAYKIAMTRYTEQMREFDRLLAGPDDGEAAASDLAAYDLGIEDKAWRKDIDQVRRVRDKIERAVKAKGLATEEDAL